VESLILSYYFHYTAAENKVQKQRLDEHESSMRRQKALPLPH